MSGKYVKKIRREWYEDGKKIDTAVDNYGRVITTNPRERALFEGILSTAEETGAIIETLWKFVVALLARPQPAALVNRLLDKDNPSQVDLSDYFPSLKGKTVFDPNSLKKLRKLAYLSREPLEGGYRPNNEPRILFWECFYERLRSDEFPNAPSRYTSFFLFFDLDSALVYARKHPTGTQYLFCDVSATTTRTEFLADMTILDEVEMKQTYAFAAEQIRRYWRQERSSKPLIEVLFQGEACLGKRIRPSIV